MSSRQSHTRLFNRAANALWLNRELRAGPSVRAHPRKWVISERAQASERVYTRRESPGCDFEDRVIGLHALVRRRRSFWLINENEIGILIKERERER